MARLDDAVVLVTGAAQGMGRTHVEHLLDLGARVVATDVRADAVETLGRRHGDRAVAMAHDVTNDAEWRQVVGATVERFGRLDGLVNNAAIYPDPRPIDEESLDRVEATLRVNVIGTWLGIRTVIEPMRTGGGGSIVNISSTAGLRGMRGISTYGLSKWAVRGLTKSAAADLGRYGIRVNSVHPGAISGTGMFPGTPEAVERMRRVPLGRPGARDEVSALVAFLLSEESSYVTGVEHVVDGGATLA